MNYYYRDGNEVPFCPKCWENDKKEIHLPSPVPWNGGSRRDCRVCSETWEQPMDLSQQQIKTVSTLDTRSVAHATKFKPTAYMSSVVSGCCFRLFR
jgi:hypothetical protein